MVINTADILVINNAVQPCVDSARGEEMNW